MTVTKQQWRARMLARRRDRPEVERAVAHEATARQLLAVLATAPTAEYSPRTICVFYPLPSEPVAADLPERLVGAGFRVLVPVARPGVPLDWCELAADGAGHPTGMADDPADTAGGSAGAAATAVTGPLGIAEPGGPRLGPAAIRLAEVVLVPALAVDGAGTRLGRGGGHYDRSLALLPDGTGPRVIAVVYDDEVVGHLPQDAHDVPVTDVLTPSGGLRHVALRARPGASSI